MYKLKKPGTNDLLLSNLITTMKRPCLIKAKQNKTRQTNRHKTPSSNGIGSLS